jgi:hypothetical protein
LVRRDAQNIEDKLHKNGFSNKGRSGVKARGLWFCLNRKKQGRFFRSQEQLRLNKSQSLLQ